MILTVTTDQGTYDDGAPVVIWVDWTIDQIVTTDVVTGTNQDGLPTIVTTVTTDKADTLVSVTDANGGQWVQTDATPGHATFTGAAYAGTVTVVANATNGARETATVDLAITEPPPVVAFPPARGTIFYGASEDAPIELANLTGVPLGLDREYFQADQAAAMADYANKAAGLCLLSIKPQGTWADIADGKQDVWLRDILTRLEQEVGRPVLWTIHHEPENNVSGTAMTAATFKAMCEYVVRFKTPAAKSGVWFGPVLMGGKYNPIAAPSVTKRLKLEDWTSALAGEFLGFDAYNHWSVANGLLWRSVSDTFGWMVNGGTFKNQPRISGLRDIAPNLPIVVAEYGVRDDPTAPTKAADWMREAYQWFLDNGIAGSSFFSSGKNVNDGGTSWKLSGGPRLDAFTELAKRATSVHL